jgi:hypothetical protein
MISDRAVEQAIYELSPNFSGSREPYFGLLYLERELQIPRENAVRQIAFQEHGCGIDGFHFEAERRTFYLFHFMYSVSGEAFNNSLQRFIAKSAESFREPTTGAAFEAPFLIHLQAMLAVNRALIDKVCFRFVFRGNPYELERSDLPARIVTEIERNEPAIVSFFNGRKVKLTFDFRTSNWGTAR